MKLEDHLQRVKPRNIRSADARVQALQILGRSLLIPSGSQSTGRILPVSLASINVYREQIFYLLSKRNWRLSSLKVI